MRKIKDYQAPTTLYRKLKKLIRMKMFLKKRFIKKILIGTFSIVLLFFLFVFIVIPVIYKNSYNLQKALVFLNMVHVPVDFEHPEKYMNGVRNFYLKTDDNVTLGVWHLLPQKLIDYSPEKYDTALSGGEPIILYLHGNSGNRGAGHRIDLYKLLQNQNYHIVAFDYRSYGDSSPIEPSELGVVEDSKTVYKWLKKKAAGLAKIIIWGHSLGTGISSHLVDILESEGERVTGLILESPFNNMKEEIRSYPLAKFFIYLPWFDYFFTEPMYNNGLQFESDKHLLKVSTPILILHAEDDIVIPVALGEKLYKTLQKERPNNLTTLVKFSQSERLGHKYIYKSSLLPSKVNAFVNSSIALERF
ncbi:monoacylglycerol lipase ABHD12 isoform X2 [Cimex lectularius]|uniref:AB hydrolase-1 domain-containing protein n=2 Tax=Cimex lectularius TaxID=79782 RepID=A0A8I6RTX9_CIMLE|nr:monoacylglycerol lipase ABHD12 isoform X2 [Cimex lectularius]